MGRTVPQPLLQALEGKSVSLVFLLWGSVKNFCDSYQQPNRREKVVTVVVTVLVITAYKNLWRPNRTVWRL